jgi:hypothetical protein
MFTSSLIFRTITTIINIYSKERSIGSNYENALEGIIKGQFVFSESNQHEVKANFLLLSLAPNVLY